ncbi:MAG: hypothetical protein IKM10_00910 [Bacteroidaceae bacterium]|nr:hypothetical protein [Bacteroidaceae bacterium]
MKPLHTPTPHEMTIWGVILLLIPFISLFTASITLLCGGVIESWMFPTAIILSLAIGYMLQRAYDCKASATLHSSVVVILSLLFSLLTSAIIYDHSYDGNTYHQGAISHLIQGWNPFYAPDAQTSLWEVHYAKSLEIVASTISICFNRIECGKAVNLLLILSSIFITASFLRREFPRHSGIKIALFTSLLALCPTVIRQAYIYYNDYPLYIFMLLVIIALIEIYRNNKNRLAWIILITATLFSAVTKFTIGFYTYLTLAVGIVWIFVAGKRKTSYILALASVLLIIIGFGVLGYHPYITNTLGWGNPFFPLIGSPVDIMTNNTPELYIDGNRFTNWLRSLFYNVAGTSVWIPFITDSLRDYYISYDARIAGFGPLFVYCLIASAILWSCKVYQSHRENTINKQRTITYAGIAILLISGCFIFEQSWWMRYVPFLWAVPVLLLLYTEYDHTLSRLQRATRNCCYAMLLFTQLLCCGATILGGISFTQRLGALYHTITPQSKVEIYYLMGSTSFNHKFQERDIAFTVLQEGEQPSDSTMQCVPFPNKVLIYLDAETASRIKRPDLLDFVLRNKEE